MRPRKHKLHLALVLTISLVGIPFYTTTTAATTLTITANNGSVKVTPEKAEYDEGEIVELIPKPDTGYYFTGWGGDAQGKGLVLNLTMDSDKTITADFATWQPPIGVPRPEFGIEETHLMYGGQMYDFGSGPEPYKDAGNGPYTHYVDNTHPNATDTDNPYGTESIPRKTIPRNLALAPGSVVEIHGGSYDLLSRYIVKGAGTKEKPVFIRGISELERPVITGGNLNSQGSYMIFENLYLNNAFFAFRIASSAGLNGPVDHIALRNSELEGSGTFSSANAITVQSSEIEKPENLVIYNNHIHHYGDYLSKEEGDAMGVGMGTAAQNVWIVDNHIHHNGGDSVQIQGLAMKYVYIGRNLMHEDRENAVDIKQSEHVIVSENEMYGYELSSSSTGQAVVVHYTPTLNIWITHNHIYNSRGGAMSSSGPSIVYITDNIIHNITTRGILFYDNEEVYVVGNTIYDAGTGINGSNSAALYMSNNIIANLKSSDSFHLQLLSSGMIPASDASYNLFYQEDGRVRINWGGSTDYNFSEFKSAFPDKSEGCIEADPLFVDMAGGNVSLQAGSPAIDKGTSSGVVQQVYDRFQQLYGIDIRKDIEGTPRTGTWDIGAYEYGQGLVLSLSSTNGGSVTNPGEGSFPYDDVTVVSIEAMADVNYYFVNWTGTAVDAGKVANPNAASTTVTVDAYYALKANFDTDLNVLAISSTSGGSVTNPGEGLFLYDDGTIVSIQATANENYHFVNWTGTAVDAGLVADPGSTSITVTMNADYTLQANFSIDQHNLTISSTSGGTVTTPGEGTYPYDHGTAASVTATPTANYHFVNWTGTAVDSGKVANASAASTTVTVDADYTIQANFAIDQHTLTISSTSGGTVTTPGEDTYSYDHGTTASIVTGPEANYFFLDWTGTAVDAGKVANPNAASTIVTVDADYTIRANFGQSDGIAPTVTNRLPDADDVQVPLNSLVSLHVTDADIGVKASTVTIALNGDTIYMGDALEYSSATGICRRIGTRTDYTYAYQSNEMFDYDQTITITVNASDIAGIAMSEQYSFVTEMYSFGQNKQVNSGLDNNDGPVTVCDSNGNIWAAWQAGPIGNRDIYVNKLASGEENFGGTVQLTDNMTDQFNPAVALDSDGRLYLVWQDNREGDWDIYLSTSVDGISWSTEIRVNDPNEGNQVNPAIVIDGQDFAHVVWQDDSAGNQDIYIATSNDEFVTKTVSQITSDTSNQTEPAIAADSANTIYVVWTDMRNGSNDIYGAASNNLWTEVPIVSNANNQSSPAIATESAGSILHLLWVDDTSGDNDIYYASSDGLPGSPLTGSSIIDDSSGADQLDPTIAVTGNTDNNLKVFACWQDWRNTDTDLYFAELSAGSGTNVFVGDSSSNADQSEPAIGIGEYDHPYIIWADNRSTVTDIYYAGSTFVEPVALASELVTASASSSTTVGTDPQAITTIDDVSIVVPVGACSFDVTITVAKIVNLPEFAAPCLGGYDFGPSGIQFSQPVTITIPYAFSSSDGSVTPYWFNSLTGTLSQQGITDIQDIPISSSLYALSFKTTHFTAFFLLAGGGTTAVIVGGGGGGGCSVSASGEGNIVEYMLPYIVLVVVMTILKMRDARDRKARNMTAGKC